MTADRFEHATCPHCGAALRIFRPGPAPRVMCLGCRGWFPKPGTEDDLDDSCDLAFPVVGSESSFTEIPDTFLWSVVAATAVILLLFVGSMLMLPLTGMAVVLAVLVLPGLLILAIRWIASMM